MKNLKIFSWIAVAGLAICMIAAIVLYTKDVFAPIFTHVGNNIYSCTKEAFICASLFLIVQYIAALVFFILIACASAKTRIIGFLGIASSVFFLYPILMEAAIIILDLGIYYQNPLGYYWSSLYFYSDCGRVLFLATCIATVVKLYDNKLVKIAVVTLIGGWILFSLPEFKISLFRLAGSLDTWSYIYIVFIYSALAFYIIALTKGTDSQPALAASAPVPPTAPTPTPAATPTAAPSEVSVTETVEETAEVTAPETGEVVEEICEKTAKETVAEEPVPSKAEIEQMKAELEQLKSKLNSL